MGTTLWTEKKYIACVLRVSAPSVMQAKIMIALNYLQYAKRQGPSMTVAQWLTAH